MIKARYFSKIEKIKKPTIVSAIPSIGFSGKMCIDKIIELTKSQLIAQFDIEKLPVVFVSNGRIESPAIKLYHKKIKKGDILFLTADYQPREKMHFDFADYLIKTFKKINAKQLIVIGDIPQTSIKCKEIKIELNGKKIEHDKIPLMGFNAALTAAAFQNKMPISLILKESKPNAIDLKFMKDSINELNKKLGLGMNLKKFEQECKEAGNSREFQLKDEFIQPSNEEEGINYIG